MRAIITNAGYAALVNAQHDGTNKVTVKKVAVGTGTTAADKTDTALENEVKRIDTIAGEAVSDNVIHVTVQDESGDNYTVHEFGLILDDGTLFARYAQSDKIIEKATDSTLLLSIDCEFTDVDATQITFGDISFSNPPWSTTTQGVVQMATETEAKAGKNKKHGMTPKLVWEAIKSYFGGATGAGHGKGLDADMLDGHHGSYFFPKSGGRIDGSAQVSGNLLVHDPNNEDKEIQAEVKNNAAALRLWVEANGDCSLYNFRTSTWFARWSGSGNLKNLSGLDKDWLGLGKVRNVAQLGKSEKAADSSKLDGHSASYFFPKSGGTITGDVTIEGGSSARYYSKANGENIQIGLSSSPAGAYGIYDNKRHAWLLRFGEGSLKSLRGLDKDWLGLGKVRNVAQLGKSEKAADSSKLDGHSASYFFPKSGGTITGDVTIEGGSSARYYSKANGENIQIGLSSSPTGAYGIYDNNRHNWLLRFGEGSLQEISGLFAKVHNPSRSKNTKYTNTHGVPMLIYCNAGNGGCEIEVDGKTFLGSNRDNEISAIVPPGKKYQFKGSPDMNSVIEVY